MSIQKLLILYENCNRQNEVDTKQIIIYGKGKNHHKKWFIDILLYIIIINKKGTKIIKLKEKATTHSYW